MRKSTCAVRHLLFLALIAVLAAIPRFGSRENPASVASDSDYYLNMALVFAGEAEAFNPAAAAPGSSGSRHYARPLLSLLAAPLVRLGVSPALALSSISLLSAWTVSAALYLLLIRSLGLGLAWLPPALYLTGFPQVNWGYHILSDSLGYATAFLASLAASAFLHWKRTEGPFHPDPRLGLALVGIWFLQAVAFLARETAWFTLVVVIMMVLKESQLRRRKAPALALVVTLLLAKIPHKIYVTITGVEPVRLPFAPEAWMDPVYIVDFLSKSAVAFHLAWLVALMGLCSRGLRPLPNVIFGWGVAAALYISAGFAVNSRLGIGYPLRMTYALFPLVYILAAQAIGSRSWRAPAKTQAAVLLVAANAAVSLIGVALDPGTSVILAPDLGTADPVSAPG